jgi:hypothetical protein
MLRHVSTSVCRHQGAVLLLAKITCMTSVEIDCKTGKIHKIVRQIKYINVMYTILKKLVCKTVFFDVAVYTAKKIYEHFITNKTNSVALVRERTIPTERPPPVGEVRANFCG